MTDRRTFIRTTAMGLLAAANAANSQQAARPIPSMPPVIDAVDNTGLATGRGAQIVVWVDDDEHTKVTVTADASGRWSHQFLLPRYGNHRINGYDPATGATVVGMTFVTTASPAPPSMPPRYGLAAKYPGDVGIGKDPVVYLAVDLKAANPWQGFQNPPPRDYLVDTDPALGIARAHMHYRKDPGWVDGVWHDGPSPIGIGFSPCTADWLFSKNGKKGPDECYMRYYWSPEADYQCTEQGKKLPGLAGRYGPYGNGGESTTGKLEPKGLSGWSARTLAFVGRSATDPVVLATYLYWADMGTGFGHAFVWNCNPVKPDDVVCIEIYVKMNTIDMSASDARGNGVGNRDGVLAVWVNGVVALSMANLRFRHHPDIHVDEVWLDHYHGGTTPAEKVHSFWMGGIVAASEYIGPINIADLKRRSHG
jgi:hypothetical protein